MSFSIKLHGPLGDAKGGGFIKIISPAFKLLLSDRDCVAADWHDQFADGAAHVVGRNVAGCHFSLILMATNPDFQQCLRVCMRCSALACRICCQRSHRLRLCSQPEAR